MKHQKANASLESNYLIFVFIIAWNNRVNHFTYSNLSAIISLWNYIFLRTNDFYFIIYDRYNIYRNW